MHRDTGCRCPRRAPLILVQCALPCAPSPCTMPQCQVAIAQPAMPHAGGSACSAPCPVPTAQSPHWRLCSVCSALRFNSTVKSRKHTTSGPFTHALRRNKQRHTTLHRLPFSVWASASPGFGPFLGGGIMATPRSITVCFAGLSGGVSQNCPLIASRGMYNHQGMPTGRASAGGRLCHVSFCVSPLFGRHACMTYLSISPPLCPLF